MKDEEQKQQNRNDLEEVGNDKQAELEERTKLYKAEKEGLNKQNRDKHSDNESK